MRLIDADKLQRTEGIFTYRFTDDLDIMSCYAYRYEDIETAPTVEAITIDWINKKRWEIGQTICKERCYPYNTTENEFTYLIDAQIALTRLLEDWKKENEIDRCR